jgi:hypothetical protein
MHRLSKPRLALILTGLGLVGLLAFWQTGRANPIPPSVVVPSVAYGGFGGASEDKAPPESRVVFVTSPVTERAAQIWVKLRKPMDMSFPNETPLEDVLKYVRANTTDEIHPGGIPIYLDPAGLREADKTSQSPVVLDLQGIPLAETLHLLLAQLDLDYEVRSEGFLHITSIMNKQSPVVSLNEEMGEVMYVVAQLRSELEALKAGLQARNGEK